MFKSGKAALLRWLKFNAVGALGTAVQLGMLAVLLRGLADHFMWATAISVEIAVVHNFFWHWRWTWADRHPAGPGGLAATLVRFNLSNGLISLTGAVVCAGLLTGFAHIPVLAANVLSFIPCWIANYFVSDRLVFKSPVVPEREGVPMKTTRNRSTVGWPLALALCVCLIAPAAAIAATLQERTLKSWDAYIQRTEARIAAELRGTAGFLRMDFMKPAETARVQSELKAGKIHVERMKTLDAENHEIHVPDGLIHHWYGAIWIPGIRTDALLAWIQDYDQQHKYFKEVEQSKLLSRNGDTFKIYLRLTRTKVVTVHYSTDHTVVYQNNGAGRASSRSFTTRIAEIDNAGTPAEKEEPAGADSGYLWRLNSYWRFREQDGGVVVECESVSLSRSIPFGLGWLVGEYVESIPRESLESALVSIRDGVKSAH